MARKGKSGGGSGFWLILVLLVLLGSGLLRFLFFGVGLLLFAGTAAIIYGLIQNNKESGDYERERKTVNTSTGRSSDHVKETKTKVERQVREPVIEMPEIDPEDQKILTQARQNMTEIRALASRVSFVEIRSAANQLASSLERVLNALRQEPEEIRDAQLFLQYTLPTASNMLKKYWQMESNGVDTPEVTYKVLAYMREVKGMADKELNAIFEDDVADIDAELEVLRQSYEEMGI